MNRRSEMALSWSGGVRVAWKIAISLLVRAIVMSSLLGCQPLSRREVGGELKQIKGRVAVSVSGVDANKGWHIRGDEPFAAGDSVAVFVLAELFRQVELKKVDLQESLPVLTPSQDQAGPAAGRGMLRALCSIEKMSVFDLALLTLANADPTAVNVLIDRLTIEEINNTAQALGAERTSIVRKIGYSAPPENYTTANDVAAVWGSLARGEGLSAATRAALDKILRTSRSFGHVVGGGLAASDLRISYDGDSPGRACLVHASGIIYLPGVRFAVAVLGENLQSNRAGEEMIERVARIVHDRHEEEARVASR